MGSFCLQGPVKSVAIDPMGTYMATAGVDSNVKIWDVRNFKTVHTYFSNAPATNLGISQQGLLAVGFGSRVQVRCLPAPSCYLLAFIVPGQNEQTVCVSYIPQFKRGSLRAIHGSNSCRECE